MGIKVILVIRYFTTDKYLKGGINAVVVVNKVGLDRPVGDGLDLYHLHAYP